MGMDLPKNWVLTTTKEISSIIRGVSYKKDDAKSIKDANDYLVLRGGNIQDGEIVFNSDQVFVDKSFVKDEQKILKGDVVIVGSTGSKKLIGKAGIAKKNLEDISFGAFLMLLRPHKEINISYFDYFFISKQYRDKIRELAGGVNINNIRKEYIADMSFPLPPLPEQTRIVAKLDQLFGQLDQIKESLDKIRQLLKDFRQQVLTQAVTGKLTEEWREGKSLSSWKGSSIGEFMKEVKDKADPQTIGSTQYIGLEHIEKDGGIINIGLSDDLKSNKTVFKAGDVLYGKLRPYLNKHAVVDFDGICSTDILVYRNINRDSANFFNYFLGLNTTIAKLNAEAKGINLPRVSSKILNNFRISIPSEEEQKIIVIRVETLFAKADVIEQQYQTLKQKIDNLPQAILHKAFKGALVPQLEIDGDARELLEEIKALKKQTAKPKTKKGNVRVSAVEPLKAAKNPNVKTKTSLKSGQTKVEPLKKLNPNVRVSASDSYRIEPLKKTKAYKVDDGELGRVAEDSKKYK